MLNVNKLIQELDSKISPKNEEFILALFDFIEELMVKIREQGVDNIDENDLMSLIVIKERLIYIRKGKNYYSRVFTRDLKEREDDD